jgi:hypothetical protein
MRKGERAAHVRRREAVAGDGCAFLPVPHSWIDCATVRQQQGGRAAEQSRAEESRTEGSQTPRGAAADSRGKEGGRQKERRGGTGRSVLEQGGRRCSRVVSVLIRVVCPSASVGLPGPGRLRHCRLQQQRQRRLTVRGARAAGRGRGGEPRKGEGNSNGGIESRRVHEEEGSRKTTAADAPSCGVTG